MSTISDLSSELLTLVQSAPSVKKKGYYAFDFSDLRDFIENSGFPIVGVLYEGTQTAENSVNPQPGSKGAAMLVAYFTVVVGVQYKYASTEDTKPDATDLLDEVRSIVLGYIGINKRPWVLSAETPIQTDIEGAVFYGQTWETRLPKIGNSSN